MNFETHLMMAKDFFDKVHEERMHDELVELQKTQNELIKKQTNFNWILALGVVITGLYYSMKLYNMSLEAKILYPNQEFHIVYLGIFLVVFALVLIATTILSKK